MTVPKNDKYKDYARYAEHCLNMVASTRVRNPTQGGQDSDDCGQPMIAA